MWRASVIVPTLDPGNDWLLWMDSLKAQHYTPDSILVVDSGSKDDTVSLACRSGFEIAQIHKNDFSHGRTRQMAVDMLHSDGIVVFLTQDAILVPPDAIENILCYFADKKIAAVCGRQLPRKLARPIEAHARIYNYGDQSFVRSMRDVRTYGMKTAFISNSFAAYRISTLNEVGGFPDNVIFGEDMYVAAKLLKAGYKIAYAADACVYHSHDYTIWQEFKRYFDMGVYHAREPWIRQDFGGAEGEGVKFVVSEMKYLVKHAFWLIPEALFRKVFGYIGFRLGLIEEHLPLWLKRRLAMNKRYF